MDHYRGGDGNTLNEQVLWHLRGDCDTAALGRALDALTARHESLRTTFEVRRRQLVQRVHPPRPVPLRTVDVSTAPAPRTAARDLIAAEVVTPIDAAVWPVRALLIRIGPAHHALAVTMHHYVSDDYSNALLSRDLRALHHGQPELEPVDWQYADWSQWQHTVLTGENLDRLRDYWTGHLAGAVLPALPEKAATPRSAGEPAFVSVERIIDPAVTAGLRRLARDQRSTLFTVLLALFYRVLAGTTGQHDLAVASLFANRNRAEVRQSVGFFVTMVLLRSQVPPDEPFPALVRRVRTVVMEAMRHQDLPFQLLPPGTVSGPGRTDDVMFQLLGSFLERADMAGDELADLEAQLERRRFALEFVLVPQGGALTALVLGARDRFDPDWAAALVDGYVRLAAQVVAEAAADRVL